MYLGPLINLDSPPHTYGAGACETQPAKEKGNRVVQKQKCTY